MASFRHKVAEQPTFVSQSMLGKLGGDQEQAIAHTESTDSGPPVQGQPPEPLRITAVPAVVTGIPAVGPAVVVTGVVVALRDVELPPSLAPAGGVVDLTIRLDATGATAVARARFETVQERAQLGSPGAPVQVLLDATNPGLVTLVSSAEPD